MIRFFRGDICFWCILCDTVHAILLILSSHRRSFLAHQNIGMFHHDEIVFPIFVMIHHIQLFADHLTWVVFYPWHSNTSSNHLNCWFDIIPEYSETVMVYNLKSSSLPIIVSFKYEYQTSLEYASWSSLWNRTRWESCPSSWVWRQKVLFLLPWL